MVTSVIGVICVLAISLSSFWGVVIFAVQMLSQSFILPERSYLFFVQLTFQDVLAKVMSFSQNGPRAVCILSANGAISNVTLRQAMTSGGTVTYEVS